MRIAIPSETAAGLESERSAHFGHAPFFTIVEYGPDMEIVNVESVKNVDHDEYGCGGVIDYVLTLGIDGIITIGMGMPPFMRFSQAGVAVYMDQTQPNVGGVAKMFAQGDVDQMGPSSACRH